MPLVAIKDIQEIDKKVDNYQKNPPQAFSEAAGDFLLYQAFAIIVIRSGSSRRSSECIFCT